MTIDTSLCKHYLYDNPGFWQRCSEVWQLWMQDEACVRFWDTLCAPEHRHNPKEMLAILRGAQAYLKCKDPENAHLSHSCFFAALLPDALELYRSLNTPEDILTATMRDFTRWAQNYKHTTGTEGLGEVQWTVLFFCGRIWELGRLQYELCPFSAQVHILRHRTSRRLVALAADGVQINSSGHISGTNAVDDIAFTTTLRCADKIVEGYRVDTDAATITQDTLRLSLSEYEFLLSPGQQVLNLHIPAAGPLAPQQVQASLEQAQRYFSLHRPKLAPVAMCYSWLLDPALASYAPGSVNILDFMRRFTKFPMYSPESSLGKFLFGLTFSWEQLPSFQPQTSTQRTAHAHLMAGGQAYDTGGIIML